MERLSEICIREDSDYHFPEPEFRFYLQAIKKRYGDTYARVFAAVDETGKGAISRDQLYQAVRLLGYNPTDEQLQIWLQDYQHLDDFNYEQFATFVAKEIRLPSLEERKEDLREAMSIIDRTNSGYIERNRLFNILTKSGEMRLTKEEAVSLIEKLDLRKDGRIHLAEVENLFVSDEDLDEVLQYQQWDMV